MKKIKQFEHNKQKTEKIHQQKLAQNRPTQSISLGQNHFKKMAQKRPTTLIRIQHLHNYCVIIFF